MVEVRGVAVARLLSTVAGCCFARNATNALWTLKVLSPPRPSSPQRVFILGDPLQGNTCPLNSSSPAELCPEGCAGVACAQCSHRQLASMHVGQLNAFEMCLAQPFSGPLCHAAASIALSLPRSCPAQRATSARLGRCSRSPAPSSPPARRVQVGLQELLAVEWMPRDPA